MKTLLALVAAAIAATVCAASVYAGVNDPRKCSGTTVRSAHCAHDAAVLVARRVLARKVNDGIRLWQPPLTCSSAGTLLRWRCYFATGRTDVLPAKGYVAVTYKATSTGWRVYTSIVASP